MNDIKENLYQMIKNLQGPKHPQYNYSELNKCADDIVHILTAIGLTVQEQTFFVKGDLRPYRNILAYWNELKSDAILIGSHYDTVPFSPGANDNLSAVAVSIELARLFSSETLKPNICFAFFTLEEGHPGYFAIKHQQLLENGIVDEVGNFTSVNLFELSKALGNYIDNGDSKLKFLDKIDNFIEQGEFSEIELLYLKIRRNNYKDFLSDSPTGQGAYTVGSNHFADEMHSLISRAIVMDCLGWVGDEVKVNSLIPLNGLENFVTTYKSNPYDNIGNYLSFVGDSCSQDWLDEFQKHCSSPGNDFPHVSIQLPIPYETIKEIAPDTLRSDHAPFWRKGIPAIFITDTANFRSNRYHTPADTLDAINYAFLAKFVESLFNFIKLS